MLDLVALNLLPLEMRFAILFCLFAANAAFPNEPVHRLTLAEYEATLSYWTEKHPDKLTTEAIGTTREGLSIHLLKITDSSTPAGNKQHSLITALHGGPERSGTTGCLRVVEWLLSDDPLAVETRKRQEVWLIPIINPYAYFSTDRFGNSLKIDPYTGGGITNWDLETMSFSALDRAPEMKAFLETVDRFQPEAHLDLHGTGLQEYPDEQLGTRQRYDGQIMTEITGSAYSNFVLRPWDWRITEAMIRGGEEAGFPSDRFEADAQRLLVGSLAAPLAKQHWRGRAQFYSAQYGYTKYHTLIAALEIAWEESALARTKAWLRFGNEVPAGENAPGYPVDRVKAFVGHFVTASGTSAEERRQSRIRLWQCQGGFSQGFLYPQTDGRILYAVSTGPSTGDLLSSEIPQFFTNTASRFGDDAKSIGAFVKAGPEIKLAVEKGGALPGFVGEGLDPTEFGIGFRLRIPYPNTKVDQITLNGVALPDAAIDGFQAFPGNGFTQIQINLSPEKASQAAHLFVITCQYTPPSRRRVGWTPPKEVLEQLNP
jgi:hypothetical protein